MLKIAACVLFATALLCGSYGIFYKLPTSPLEAWIFLTGAATVWLAVKESVWNWPIGLVNVALWTVMFSQQRLFANVGLQIVYVITGLLGWYWWARRGEGHESLEISSISGRVHLGIWGVCLILSYPVQLVLMNIGGAATYWDGLTTLLSLAGQALLMRKVRQTWYFWIVADCVYIGLFLSQSLYLGAGLYAILLAMCFVGIRDWRKTDAT